VATAAGGVYLPHDMLLWVIDMWAVCVHGSVWQHQNDRVVQQRNKFSCKLHLRKTEK
jgi:hypothetical protein